MCDRIIMPDGTEIDSINQDGECLCANTQTEILRWIVERSQLLEIWDKLIIEYGPFGWDVSISKMDAGVDNRTK